MRLTINKNVKLRDPNHKVFCQEEYAQDVYEKYCDWFEGKGTITSKDLVEGQICKAQVVRVANGKILVQTDSSQTIYLDLIKESKFLEKQEITTEIKPGLHLDIYVESTKNDSYLGSIEKAFKAKLKKDLTESMKNKNMAYNVTIKSINDGGFIVDLSGMDCFMPGSLAAANKITNFEEMIGKQVYVMVENYLEQSDMFVVSNKRYIQNILPSKVKELDYSQEYVGRVTGTKDYGAFVEWDEIFTGLLHESEVSGAELKSLRPGDEIKFWVKEIKENRDTKDIRIILSQKGPSTEAQAFQTLKDKYEGEIYPNASVKDVRPFGVFIELSDGIIGMMPPREFKRTNAKMKEGEMLDVFVKQVDTSARRIHLAHVRDDED